MSFGMPKGSARMPAVTIEVPPPPPMPTMRGDVVAACATKRGEGLAHAGDRGAAVVEAEDRGRAVRMVRGDLGGGDVGGDGRRARADVDGQRLAAGRARPARRERRAPRPWCPRCRRRRLAHASMRPPRRSAPCGGGGFLPVRRVEPGVFLVFPARMPAVANTIAFVLRRPYRIDMAVSSQARAASEARETGPRARTRRLLLDTAMTLMQAGRVPSVTDVAEAAEVSRATAYRYFPTQAALVQAAVDEALGPILAWRSEFGRRRGAGRGAARLRLSAHRRVRGDAAGGAAAGDGAMEPAPGRDARRRGADRARQPARPARQRAGAAAGPVRPADVRPAARRRCR